MSREERQKDTTDKFRDNFEDIFGKEPPKVPAKPMDHLSMYKVDDEPLDTE